VTVHDHSLLMRAWIRRAWSWMARLVALAHGFAARLRAKLWTKLGTYGVPLLGSFPGRLVRRSVTVRMAAAYVLLARNGRGRHHRPRSRMSSKTALFGRERDEAVVPRVHYESAVYQTMAILWSRRSPIAALVGVAVLLASLVLVLIGPRYTGEATIQLNFVREESATGVKSQPTAAVDATTVVDSAARIIRSRATAAAVVTRLGLDKDAAFTRRPISWSVFSGMRSAVGLHQVELSDYDVAVHKLMGRIAVTTDPRSYLISISVTTADPERSAALANAVAVAYLRGQFLQQTAEAYATAGREMEELRSVYGVRHPSYMNGKAKLEGLKQRLDTLGQTKSDEDAVRQVVGQSFVAAEKVMVPSGPNIPLILGLTAGIALIVGGWLARLLEPRRDVGSDRLTVLGERTLEPVRTSYREG
jgi:capsular polysaccharide biosynthesis protein